MLVVEVLVVLCISTQLEVLFRLSVVAVVTIVVRSVADVGADVVTFTMSEVTTHSQVETQVLKTVNLVINVGTTNERAGLTAVIMVVEHCHGVVRSVCVLGVGPSGIGVVYLQPIEVATYASILRIVAVDGLSGVHANCITHGTCVGEARLGPSELTIEIHGQMVVQERWAQVNGHSVTLVVGGLEDTLLVGVTK